MPYSFLEDSGEMNAFFIQCLFEAQSVKLDFQSTFRNRTMCCGTYSMHTSLDYYALGYCIANCTTPESSWEVTFIEYDSINAKLETFSQGQMTKEFSTGVITKLHVPFHLRGARPIAANYVGSICIPSATSPLCSISDLQFKNCIISSTEERIHLFELILHMPHLKKLDISYSDLCNAPGSPYCACRDTDGLLKLFQYLLHSKVTLLDIRSTGLEYFLEQSPLAEDYSTAVQALISPHSNLRELKIGPCKDSCLEGNLTMISLVSAPSSLRKLCLDLSMSHPNNLLSMRAFKTDNYLTELQIECSRRISDLSTLYWPVLLPDIVRIIHHSTRLEKLNLFRFHYWVDKDVLMDIATALQRNKTLNQLYIYLPFDPFLEPIVEAERQQLQELLRAVDSRISVF